MNARRILVLVAAAMLSSGLFILARGMLAPTPPLVTAAGEPAPAPPPEIRVLVSAADLRTGTIVKAENLEWKSWKHDDPALKSFAVEGRQAKDLYVGAVVRTSVTAGQPVTGELLIRPGERGFLAAVLQPGMRAVSVPVNSITGIAGFVFPGDRVDLILTLTVVRPDDPELNERRVGQTVLRNVRVLAIDQKTGGEASAPAEAKVATLEVTEPQAEKVAVAVQLGQLSLSLRSLDDEPTPLATIASADEASLDQVLRSESASSLRTPEDVSMQGFTWDSEVTKSVPAPARKAQVIREVKVFRGSQPAAPVSFDMRR
jgi:pilus assembly protein CpaB